MMPLPPETAHATGAWACWIKGPALLPVHWSPAFWRRSASPGTHPVAWPRSQHWQPRGNGLAIGCTRGCALREDPCSGFAPPAPHIVARRASTVAEPLPGLSAYQHHWCGLPSAQGHPILPMEIYNHVLRRGHSMYALRHITAHFARDWLQPTL